MKAQKIINIYMVLEIPLVPNMVPSNVISKDQIRVKSDCTLSQSQSHQAQFILTLRVHIANKNRPKPGKNGTGDGARGISHQTPNNWGDGKSKNMRD